MRIQEGDIRNLTNEYIFYDLGTFKRNVFVLLMNECYNDILHHFTLVSGLSLNSCVTSQSIYAYILLLVSYLYPLSNYLQIIGGQHKAINRGGCVPGLAQCLQLASIKVYIRAPNIDQDMAVFVLSVSLRLRPRIKR